jgi:homoaconitase/3-isopropylmalate dehydratase large subunit
MRQLASTCPDMQLTFCNQIIEVVGAAGTVNIDKNTFYQVCGQDLPGGSKGGSAPNSPIKWIRDNRLAFIAIVLAGLLVIGALAWIARTLFRRR